MVTILKVGKVHTEKVGLTRADAQNERGGGQNVQTRNAK